MKPLPPRALLYKPEGHPLKKKKKSLLQDDTWQALSFAYRARHLNGKDNELTLQEICLWGSRLFTTAHFQMRTVNKSEDVDL